MALACGDQHYFSKPFLIYKKNAQEWLLCHSSAVMGHAGNLAMGGGCGIGPAPRPDETPSGHPRTAPLLLSGQDPRGTQTNPGMQWLLAEMLLDCELSYSPMQAWEGKGFCPSTFPPLQQHGDCHLSEPIGQRGRRLPVTGCEGNLAMGSGV